MKPVKKVSVRRRVDSEESGVRADSEEALVGARQIQITLTDGSVLEVELFERTPGRLMVRGVAPPFALAVYPHASNVVCIGADQRS